MSTHLQELLNLKAKAEPAGRTVRFNLDGEGRIDSVFYIDPKAPPGARSHTGITVNPLTFAEMERPKPDPTLNQLLAYKGYTTKPANRVWSAGDKYILKDGQVVFTGDAYEVTAWLKKN